MFCRLTLLGGLISLAATSPGQSTAPRQPTSRPPAAAAARYSIDWEELPLADAVRRLTEVARVDVFVDRRVDPTRLVTLSVTDADVDEIETRLAAAAALGQCRIGSLAYLGPPSTADRLVALAAARRGDVAALPTDEKRSLLERRRIVWPRLTEPRELVVQLLQEHGWTLVGSERIPHDLWAAGSLPALPLADQLTVLLAGFDRTFRMLPDQHALEIVAVDWKSIRPVAPPAAGKDRDVREEREKRSGKRVFTLRVENQPVGKVLDQLARRLGWALQVDEATIRAAGRSLDQRVSFSTENADEDQLLEALLAPAGLRAQRSGKEVTVEPR